MYLDDFWKIVQSDVGSELTACAPLAERPTDAMLLICSNGAMLSQTRLDLKNSH